MQRPEPMEPVSAEEAIRLMIDGREIDAAVQRAVREALAVNRAIDEALERLRREDEEAAAKASGDRPTTP